MRFPHRFVVAALIVVFLCGTTLSGEPKSPNIKQPPKELVGTWRPIKVWRNGEEQAPGRRKNLTISASGDLSLDGWSQILPEHRLMLSSVSHLFHQKMIMEYRLDGDDLDVFTLFTYMDHSQPTPSAFSLSANDLNRIAKLKLPSKPGELSQVKPTSLVPDLDFRKESLLTAGERRGRQPTVAVVRYRRVVDEEDAP